MAHEIVASCASPPSLPKSRRRQFSPGQLLQLLNQPRVLQSLLHPGARVAVPNHRPNPITLLPKGVVWSPGSGIQILMASMFEAGAKQWDVGFGSLVPSLPGVEKRAWYVIGVPETRAA